MATVAPAIKSVSFDKPSYAPGDKITVTVEYSGGASERVVNFTGQATDVATNEKGELNGSFTIMQSDPTQLLGSDSENRSWTLESNENGVAVFSSIA